MTSQPTTIKAIIWKEDDMYVIKDAILGITTQGKTIDEAMKNLREAIELYLEEFPEERERLKGYLVEFQLNRVFL